MTYLTSTGSVDFSAGDLLYFTLKANKDVVDKYFAINASLSVEFKTLDEN